MTRQLLLQGHDDDDDERRGRCPLPGRGGGEIERAAPVLEMGSPMELGALKGGLASLMHLGMLVTVHSACGRPHAAAACRVVSAVPLCVWSGDEAQLLKLLTAAGSKAGNISKDKLL